MWDLPCIRLIVHVFFMQNTCIINAFQNTSARRLSKHWTLTALRSVEFSDFTQLQHSGCKANRMQRGRIFHWFWINLTVNLTIINRISNWSIAEVLKPAPSPIRENNYRINYYQFYLEMLAFWWSNGVRYILCPTWRSPSDRARM